jgi:hypothetical protein
MLFLLLLGLNEKSLKAGVIKKTHNSLPYITVKTIIFRSSPEFKLGLLRFMKNKLSNRYPLRADHKNHRLVYKQTFFYDYCEFFHPVLISRNFV